MADHSPVESCSGARDRRVSAEQGGALMRILSGAAAELRVTQLANRSCEFSALEPKVRRIVEDVRRAGDRALRAYAQKWDGLPPSTPIRVSEQELSDAVGSVSPRFRTSVKQAATNIRRFCQWQRPRAWTRRTSGMSLGQVV